MGCEASRRRSCDPRSARAGAGPLLTGGGKSQGSGDIDPFTGGGKSPQGRGDMDPLKVGGKCPQGRGDKDPVMAQRLSEFMAILGFLKLIF